MTKALTNKNSEGHQLDRLYHSVREVIEQAHGLVSIAANAALV